MKRNSRIVFEKELAQVKAIKDDKSRPRRDYDKAMQMLNEIIKTYEFADELGYSKEILERIKNSKNGIEAQNILTDARRAS